MHGQVVRGTGRGTAVKGNVLANQGRIKQNKEISTAKVEVRKTRTEDRCRHFDYKAQIPKHLHIILHKQAVTFNHADNYRDLNFQAMLYGYKY